MTQEERFIVQPGGSLRGSLKVPGDKSVSHRSIMLGALAEGRSHITGFLEGEDSLNTLRAFRAMGVEISEPDNGRVVIDGVGLHGLQAPAEGLYLGNSGTAMRLMAGVMAAQRFDSELQGDKSLTGRPMQRVIDPLAQMGASIDSREGGRPPLKIHGGCRLKAIDYVLPMASAQVKSCVLLAGLYADGETVVTEPAPTRDHTERMLQALGYEVNSENGRIRLCGGGVLHARDLQVPADISSAAFFMVGASIAGDADMTLEAVCLNPTRTGVIEILRLMGADIEIHNERLQGGEPVGDIRVRSAHLKGVDIPESLVPLAIDEFPVLFVAAACAEGSTVLRGAEELRVKESDRIQVMADGLQILGVDAEPTPDGIRIEGVGPSGRVRGGRVESHGDHRTAMAFSIAGLRADAEIVVDRCANVRTSFPGFVDLAAGAGLEIAAEPVS